MTVQKSITRISPLSWNRGVIRKGSVARSCPTLWDPMDCIAYQPPLSMELSRQEYQNGLSFPPPGNLPNPGIEPGSPSLQADALPSEPPGNNSSAAQVMSNSLQPHELQHTRLSCSSPMPGACSNSCPSSRWCHPTILSSVIPFSCCAVEETSLDLSIFIKVTVYCV